MFTQSSLCLTFQWDIESDAPTWLVNRNREIGNWGEGMVYTFMMGNMGIHRNQLIISMEETVVCMHGRWC